MIRREGAEEMNYRSKNIKIGKLPALEEQRGKTLILFHVCDRYGRAHGGIIHCSDFHF
jgi:hypothetical protein